MRDQLKVHGIIAIPYQVTIANMSEEDTVATIDEAMVVIQDSTATITATTKRLTDMESGNKKVLEVVENLLTKVSNLESKVSSNVPHKQSKVNPPLYIRVSHIHY